LNWLKFQNLYGVIATPIILLVALHPEFKAENINRLFILGCIITFLVALYLCIMLLRSYLILKKIDLHTGSVIQSLNEITKLKEISNRLQKSVFIHYPLMGAGIMLMIWKNVTFTTNAIILLSVFFVITYILNIWRSGKDKEKFDNLEKDIIELKEYTEN